MDVRQVQALAAEQNQIRAQSVYHLETCIRKAEDTAQHMNCDA
jgi:hypothetical protein